MSKLYLILGSIICVLLFYSCGRDSSPAELTGFSEGEYYGSFELRFEGSNIYNYEILRQGEIDFLFEESAFYYNGSIEFSYNGAYPSGIGSRGKYMFVNDTIYFKEDYIPQNPDASQTLNLSYFFTCEYSGGTMYLTQHIDSEKFIIILRKR